MKSRQLCWILLFPLFVSVQAGPPGTVVLEPVVVKSQPFGSIGLFLGAYSNSPLFPLRGSPIQSLQVEGVVVGSAADSAGIKLGDNIVEINGIPIAKMNWKEIRKHVLEVGDAVTLVVRRKGSAADIPLRVVAVRVPPSQLPFGTFGFRAHPKIEDGGGHYALEVVRTEGASASKFPELQDRDLILKINERTVTEAVWEEFQKYWWYRAKAGDVITVAVRHPGTQTLVNVPLKLDSAPTYHR